MSNYTVHVYNVRLIGSIIAMLDVVCINRYIIIDKLINNRGYD